jgi:hypothetical protein
MVVVVVVVGPLPPLLLLLLCWWWWAHCPHCRGRGRGCRPTAPVVVVVVVMVGALLGCNTGMGKPAVFPKQVRQVWVQCWILTHHRIPRTRVAVLWVSTGLFAVGLLFLFLF